MPLSPGHTPVDIQNHLYNAFLKRATTDICLYVHAQGWSVAYDLHRVVLIQSGFFQSLFTRGFRESSRQARTPFSDSRDVIDIQFDDPNITRAAFEVCISWLYGGGPSLHVQPGLIPNATRPLTPHYLAPPPYTPPPDGQHPATPRFLLALIATSIYLSIPSVTASTLGLALSTVGPSTVIQYLNFALGNGIGDAGPGDLNCAVGLEKVGRDLTDDDSGSARAESLARAVSLSSKVSVSTTDEGDVLAEATESEGSSTHKHEGGRNSVSPVRTEDGNLLFSYGVVSNKIGEACASWLARWATDLFPYELDYYATQVGRGGVASSHPSTSTPLPPAKLNHSRASSHPPRSGLSVSVPPASPSLTGRRSTVSFARDSSQQPRLLPPNVKPPTVWSRNGGLTAKWVRGLLSSNDLFLPGGEMDRYEFATQVVELRRHQVLDSKREEAPFSPVLLDDEEETEWDILFSTGFYYTHMSLEDLIHIQNDISPTTQKPYVPLSTLQSALWDQSVLRSQIMSMSSINSPRSGSPQLPTTQPGTSAPAALTQGAPSSPTAWQDAVGISLGTPEIVSARNSTPASKAFFPVLGDGSHKFGGELAREVLDSLAEDVAGADVGTPERTNPLTKRVMNEGNFFGLMLNGRKTVDDMVKEEADPSMRWTENAPCRFSVEFWGVESLKPSQRLYSHTVWCMGSLWNVYVQIVRKKGLQLGVYLQRQSFVDPIPPHSVPVPPTDATSLPNLLLHSSISVPSFTGSIDRPATPGRSRPWAIHHDAASTTNFPQLQRTPTPGPVTATVGTPPSATTIPFAPQTVGSGPFTAPSASPGSPYRDPRQSIRAYFSIACPSATGSSSTKFSSAPDCFNVTQSWGWKSSKPEEWVDFEGEAGPSGSGERPKVECSLRATIVLGIV